MMFRFIPNTVFVQPVSRVAITSFEKNCSQRYVNLAIQNALKGMYYYLPKNYIYRHIKNAD